MMHNITKIFIFHYSQTKFMTHMIIFMFDYHMKLHYSQTTAQAEALKS